MEELVYFEGDKEGKTFVQFQLIWQGNDLIVVISGGQAHFGSIAHTKKREAEENYQFVYKDHREDEIVRETINRLALHVSGELLVVGGIHYDEISREQIQNIVANCSKIIRRIEQHLQNAKSDYRSQ